MPERKASQRTRRTMAGASRKQKTSTSNGWKTCSRGHKFRGAVPCVKCYPASRDEKPEAARIAVPVVETPSPTRVTRSHVRPSVPAAVTPHVGAMPPGRHDAPSVPTSRITRGLGFLLALAFVMSGGMLIKGALAATFQGPTEAPPGGNIPTTIWNTEGLALVQADASLAVDGQVHADFGATFGGQGIDFDASSGGENLLYGVGSYALMHPQDRLMLLQTESGGAYTDRFVVSRDGDVSATGCFGPVFAGLTTNTFRAGVAPATSYYAVDAQCDAEYAGSHVCTAQELLQSLSCSEAGDPIRSVSGEVAWINGGPPGHTSNANDCVGWSNDGSLCGGDPTLCAYGRYWSFDTVSGGFGTMTSCNAPGIKFACCK